MAQQGHHCVFQLDWRCRVEYRLRELLKITFMEGTPLIWLLHSLYHYGNNLRYDRAVLCYA